MTDKKLKEVLAENKKLKALAKKEIRIGRIIHGKNTELEVKISDLKTKLKIMSAFKGKWQPMLTAPKNGLEILLFTQGRQCVQGYWSVDNKHWAVLLYDDDNEPLILCNSIEKARKRNGGKFWTEMFEVKPKAWMPLPPTPKKINNNQGTENV